MRILIFILALFIGNVLIGQESIAINYLQLSVDMVDDLKKDKEVSQYVKTLKSSTLEDLEKQLQSDPQKLAFWVNIYNAYIQYFLMENPDLYEDKSAFFAEKQIQIAGRVLSFADIEHGIIRRSQLELFLGYFTNPFAPKYEKKLRVKERDWRIHFALNCGAKDCPPVATYHAETLDQEFDYMTSKYLKEQSRYIDDEDRVVTVSLFSWFRGDFGGPKGIRKILKDYGVVDHIPDKVRVKEYDWTLDLGNFREIEL